MYEESAKMTKDGFYLREPEDDSLEEKKAPNRKERRRIKKQLEFARWVNMEDG